MSKKKILAIVVSALVILFAAPLVSAHANLVKSDPPANSAQKIPPTRVQLFFSEAVEPSFSSISVQDRTGKPYDKRDTHLIAGNSQGLEISLDELPLGLYTVAWQTLSAVDGHDTKGSFVFTVGDAPLSDSDPRTIIAAVDSALDKYTLPPASEVIVRWLNILFLVALAGAFTFPLLILFPAIRIARDNRPIVRGWLEFSVIKSAHPRDDPTLTAWTTRWQRFVSWAFFAFSAATFAMLFMQASKTADGFASIPRILTSTRFGTLWMIRVLLLAALGWIHFRARADWTIDARKNRALLIAITLITALVLNQSLNSHDAAVSDPPYVGLVVDFVHLAGSAIWIGGLLQLVFTLPAFLRVLPPNEQPRQLRAMIATFSLVAIITVGIIIASGAGSLIFQVGSVQAFFDTLYGESLFLKFLLILPLLALGALNLIVLRNAAIHRVNPFLRKFGAAVSAEIVLAVLIFLIVGVMTSTAPAITAYDPNAPVTVQTHHVDDPSVGSGQVLNITLGMSSNLVGTGDFDVKVVDSHGNAVSDAEVVRLLGTHLQHDMGTQEYTATNQGDGHYTFRGGIFTMVGNWSVEILVRRPGRYDARTTFEQTALIQAASPNPRPLIENSQALIGLGISILAFAIGTASALAIAKKRSRLASLGSAVTVSLVGWLIVYQAVISAPPQDVVVIPIAPPYARTLRSPVRPDPATLAAGKQIYQQNCATCHGDSGRGDGPAAASLNPKPFDLTIHVPQHAEGELFWWVTNGISGTAMIAWESQLSDLRRWQVVQYIRTLGLTLAPTIPSSNAQNGNVIRQDAIVRGTRVSFAVTPRTNDLSDYEVTLQDASGQPISDAARVALISTMTQMTHGTTYIELAPGGNGIYRAQGPWVYMEGKWSIGLVAQLKNGETFSAAFKFDALAPTGNPLSRTIENSPTQHQQINVSVYLDTLDLKRVDIQANRAVRVTAILVDAQKQNCGSKMTLAELNQSVAFSDAGIAELSFIAPRAGQLRFKCTQDGLLLTIKNPNDPEE